MFTFCKHSRLAEGTAASRWLLCGTCLVRRSDWAKYWALSFSLLTSSLQTSEEAFNRWRGLRRLLQEVRSRNRRGLLSQLP